MVIQQQPSSLSDRPQVSSMVKSRRRSVSPAEPSYRLAQALVKQEKWQEAIAAYQQALIITPNWVEVQRELGDLFLKLERWDEAVQVYETAISLRSESAEVYHNLGDALLKLQRWEDAIAAYEKAIELNPEFSWSYNNLGDGLRELQRWDEAAQAYGKAIELKPDFALSHHNLGDILVKKEDWEGAIAAYQKAIELDPNFVWSHYNLAASFEQLGQWDEAVETYQQVLKLQPDLLDVEEKLNQVLHQQVKARLETALSYYRQAIENDPMDVENYHKALEIKPDDAELYLGLGNAWIAKGEVEKAIAVYQSAIRINPGLNEAKFKLEQLLKQTTSQKPLTIFDQEQTKEEALTTNIAQVTSDITVNIQTTDVRLIAFYLPQYHPIPENDEWWGKGFTEWTNVSKAQPLFEGHYQPHLPADLGFYDLRLPEVREAQAQLARQYGIYGFCYYYYWFAGKRLLDRPLDEMLESKKPDFPFCLCWANENWTRRWDGLEQEILMAQEYSDGSYKDFAESLIPYLSDPRYIRVQGRPLILVYRIAHLPKPKEAISIWRQVFRERGIGEVHIAGVLGFGLQNPVELGCDSGVEFPPNSISSFPLSMPELVSNNNFSGAVYDYKQTAINTLKEKFPDYQLFPTIMTSWDNTARRQKNATVWLNSEPENYELWMRGTIEKVLKNSSSHERIIFINAWNEWAEGAHLEPDQKYGHAYLEATQKALLGQHSIRTAVYLLKHSAIENAEELEHHLLNLANKIAAEDPDIDSLTTLIENQEITWVNSVEIFHHSEHILFNLESPKQSSELMMNSIFISGWILLKNSDENLTIEVTSGDRVVQEIPVNLYRLDVANAYPENPCKLNAFQKTISLDNLSFFHEELTLILRIKVNTNAEAEKIIGKLNFKKNLLISKLKDFPNLTRISAQILEDLEILTTRKISKRFDRKFGEVQNSLNPITQGTCVEKLNFKLEPKDFNPNSIEGEHIIGIMDALRLVSPSQLYLGGWAFIRDQNKSGQVSSVRIYIFINNQKVCATRVIYIRPDIAQAYGNKYCRSGWYCNYDIDKVNLQPNDILTVNAIAGDYQQKIYESQFNRVFDFLPY